MVAVGGMSEQNGNTDASIDYALRMLMPILAPGGAGQHRAACQASRSA